MGNLIRKIGKIIPIPLFPAILFLIFFYAYPLVRMLRTSVYDPTLTFDNYSRFINTPAYPSVLLNTFEISIVVTLLCLFLGYPLAYLLSNQSPRVAGILMVFVLLPFFTSILVRNYAWMVLLASNGVFNQIMIRSGIISAPLKLMFNRFGVVVAMTHVMLPWMVLPLYSVMVRIDRNLTKAASNLGAGPFRSFQRVFLPLSMPGVIAGSMLVLIFGLGFFVTPSVLGSPRDTMIGQLVLMNTKLLNWGFASTMAVVLLILTLIILVIGNKFVGFGQIAGAVTLSEDISAIPESPKKTKKKSPIRRGTLTGSSFFSRTWNKPKIFHWIGKYLNRIVIIFSKLLGAPANLVLRYRKALLWIFCICILIFLILPILIVVPISFSSAMFLTFPPPGFSLQWYEKYFTNRTWISATLLSFRVAIITMILAITLATPAAIAFARRDFRLKTILYTFILTPLIVPEVIIGLAVYFLMAEIKLVDTSTGLILGHTVFALPPAIIVIGAALQSFDWSLERAAMSLGADRIRTLFKVTIPIIFPAILTAGLFAFLRSFDELVMALMIGGIRATTIPRKMWEGIREEINPTIASVSTLLILLTIIMMILLGIVGSRRNR
jgi:putative spermidine/putrescine transport system permease protein